VDVSRAEFAPKMLAQGQPVRYVRHMSPCCQLVHPVEVDSAMSDELVAGNMKPSADRQW